MRSRLRERVACFLFPDGVPQAQSSVSVDCRRERLRMLEARARVELVSTLASVAGELVGLGVIMRGMWQRGIIDGHVVWVIKLTDQLMSLGAIERDPTGALTFAITDRGYRYLEERIPASKPHTITL